MLPRHHEPIVAIATASGRAGVGIVRASGQDLAPLIQAICARALEPRHATFVPFRGADGEALDAGLAIRFAAPHSYTGEEVLELHAHGGPVLLQLLLARCLEAGASIGLRLALPGEFTQRAFENGKLDLAQAEAVADLIDASTEAAARSAGRSLSGAFSAEVNGLRDQVVELRALVEATLDFPEEEIEFLHSARARERLAAARAALHALLERARAGALLREGLRVVLAGQPNVGKSSLLNALAGAELAIVTPIPGTTRDAIRGSIQIEGVPLHLVDTAGLRDVPADVHAAAPGDPQADPVERLGIERSWGEIGASDVVLWLRDLTRAGHPAYDAADAALGARLPGDARRIEVWNKSDASGVPAPAGRLCISAATGAGLGALRAALLERAGWHAQPEGLFIARTRHVQALRRADEHLAQAEAHAAHGDAALDLVAEELRLAHDALGEITGATSVDELLGQIFAKFCIGK